MWQHESIPLVPSTVPQYIWHYIQSSKYYHLSRDCQDINVTAVNYVQCINLIDSEHCPTLKSGIYK